MTLRTMLAAMAIAASAGATAQERIVMLYTNDTHSAVMPMSSHLNDTLKAGRAGYIRRMAMVRQERQASPEALLFDSGDFSQGSPYYTLFRGDVEVGLMNMMGYDAATLGNHEFDYGIDNLARLIGMATFPVVCANYGVEGTPLQGLVKPYTVITRGGKRIGVFGLSPRLEGLVQQESYGGVTYHDPISTANATARTLRQQEGCHVVVCLSHLGWDESTGEIGDSTLATRTTGIDIVLGGHSHSYFESTRWVNNAEGKPVAIDQNGRHGIYVGRMEIEVE